MATTVINRHAAAPGQTYIYIGRGSDWGNPFPLDDGRTREQAIRQHAEHLAARPDLLKRVAELREQTLGCYCKPQRCHGDLLAVMADMTGMHGPRQWAAAVLTLPTPEERTTALLVVPENFRPWVEDLVCGALEMARFLQEKQERAKQLPDLALSIRQPWVWAILHAGKDIENRGWSTPFRGRFAIHAGKSYDAEGELELRGHYGLDVPRDLPRGGIVGSVDLVDCIGVSKAPAGARGVSRWFVGPYGFVLAAPHPLPFLPLRGQLGFFKIDQSIDSAGPKNSGALFSESD